MSRLTIESGQEIAERNIERIYRFPKRYEITKEYLDRYDGSLRTTLLSVLNYAKGLNLIIDKHRYEFIVDNDTLTYKVRRKSGGKATTNRHMNFLCALGFFKKVYQSKGNGNILKINLNFLREHPEMKRPISVFSFHAYTDKDLERIEDRAKRLKDAGITSGNISQNQLALNGLQDIAEEIYFANDRTAPDRKAQEAAVLFVLIGELVDCYGYASKQMIYDNLLLENEEIDKLLRIYKLQLKELYKYASPTKEEMQRWDLKDRKYIYKQKEDKEE